MNWRILRHGKKSPAENMAIDEAIMQAIIADKAMPTIRFYDWQPSTVSCGYNQEVNKEIDFQALQKFGFGFVRRPTGGRLVLHDAEVTYSVIAPIAGKFAGNVTEAYSVISQALAAGLRAMGVEVELEKGSLDSGHQRQAANPCFSSSSKYELKCKGRKIVGSAQVRRDNVLLQHGSILLNNDQSQVAYLLPGLQPAQQEKLAKYLKRKTITVNANLSKPLNFKEASLCLEKGFRDSWANDFFSIHNNLTAEEIEISTSLLHTKYLTDEWNNRK
ncbi:MAG: lipoate--protein ligase family protein [Candidatus Cloacimonadales bacterium]